MGPHQFSGVLPNGELAGTTIWIGYTSGQSIATGYDRTQRHDPKFRASSCFAPFGKVDCDDRVFQDENLRGPPLQAVAEGT